jgi:serine/threonine-protein kinase
MRTSRVALCFALPLAALLTLASPASAASPQDQAAAEVLFTDGRKLAASGDFEHGCAKFAESQRLDPASGTLLNLGDCYEKLGKFASSWATFKECEAMARLAGDSKRQAEAARRAELLTPQLAKLALVVPPDARVPGFELRRDGTLIGEGQWGSSLPIDVGTHTIEAKAPGYKPWSTEIRIDVNGAAATVRVQPLEIAPVDSARSLSFWSTRRTAAVLVGSVGLAGVVVGVVAGGLALSDAASSRSHCEPLGDATACDPNGLALRHDTRTLGNVANVALPVGGAALVTGVVLLATAPASGDAKLSSSARVRAGLALSATGLRLAIEGVW